MAKFFGLFDYSKPGRGISQDQAEFKGFKGFFTILKTKLWKLIAINFIYMLFCIPLFILFYFGSQFIVAGGTPPFPGTATEEPFFAAWNSINASSGFLLGSGVFMVDFVRRLIIGLFMLAVPVLAIGPLQAGYSHMLQSFVRQKPVFIGSDLFSKAKANFKQSMIVSIIDIILIAIVSIDLRIYFESFSSGKGGLFVTIASYVMVLAIVIYFIMHMYIYPLMVTFRMTLKQLFKNSFYLAMLSFLPGVLILILDAAIIAVPLWFLPNPLHDIILALLIIPTLVALINNYFAYPYIKKHLLDPAIRDEEERNGGDRTEPIFKD